MAKYKIKRDDTVVVVAGKHKGRTGRVLKVLPGEGRVFVEKVNLVKRQVKPTADRAGGTMEKEGGWDSSRDEGKEWRHRDAVDISKS